MPGLVYRSSQPARKPTPGARVRGSGAVASLDLRLQSADFAFATPSGQLFALRPARSAEAETLNHEGVVILLFAFAVGPVIGTNLRLKNELIALACVLRDCLPETLERDKPETGNSLAHIAVLVFARVVVADQTNSRIGRF